MNQTQFPVTHVLGRQLRKEHFPPDSGVGVEAGTRQFRLGPIQGQLTAARLGLPTLACPDQRP